MPTDTISAASRRGRASGERGKRAERDLVSWLRGNGFPGAERTVRTGHRAGNRVRADEGDVTGTGPIVWSVKDCQVERLAVWRDELLAMGGPEDLRILVHKRRGHADPGRWWAWADAGALADVLNGRLAPRYAVPGWSPWEHPVRLELAHLVEALRLAGHGDVPEPRDTP